MKKSHKTIEQLIAAAMDNYWKHLKVNKKYTMEFFIRDYQVQKAFPEHIHNLVGENRFEEEGMNRKQFQNLLDLTGNYLSQTNEDLEYCTIYIDTLVEGQGAQEISAQIRIRQHSFLNKKPKGGKVSI